MERKFKINSQYFTVACDDDTFDISVLIDDAKEEEKKQLGISHKVKLRSSSQESYDVNMTLGKWTFRNDALFLRNTEDQQFRIDFQVQYGEDPSFHDFYMVGPHINQDEIVDFIAKLISLVSSSTDIDDLVEKSIQIEKYIINRL